MLFETYYIYYVLPFFVAGFAQMIKIWIDLSRWKSFTWYAFLASGGMPSTHSTITSSALLMVMLFEGVFSPLSMISSVFAILVWYDAANVRYQAGKHAQYINSLKEQLQHVMRYDEVSDVRHMWWLHVLKERLGHTPQEILVWIIFWFSVTLWCVALIDRYIISF